MIRPTITLPRFLTVVFCVLLALISCKVFLQSGFPVTHDGENHLARFANYKIALKEGQFPPRFAPNLYHRYGYPVFNYNYPLANILSVPFSVVKVPYTFTFKLLVFTSVVLMLYGFWQWLSLLRFRTFAKFLAVLSLAVSPYLIQSIAFRGNIGEVMAMTAIIWWLVWVEQIKNRDTKSERRLSQDSLWYILGGATVLGMFFLSHNVTVLFGTPVLILYTLWRLANQRHSLHKAATAFALGLGVSMWFWIPALLEQKLIVVSGSDLAKQYQQHFPTLQQLFTAPVQFGYSYIGSVDSLSFAVGLLQMTSVFLGLSWLLVQLKVRSFKDTQFGKFFLIMLAATVFGLFLQIASSNLLWETLPLVRYIQFPWRLSLFTTLCCGALIAWVVQQGVRWQVIVLSTFALLQVIFALRIQAIGYFTKSPIEHDLFEQSTTTSNENLPSTFRYSDFSMWSPTAEVFEGEAVIQTQKWTGSRRTYAVTAQTPVTIIEPTMNFPGWHTVAQQDNIFRAVEYIDNETIGGRIAYRLEPGTYSVTTTFTQWTFARILGNAITGLTVLTVALSLLMMKLREKRKRDVKL